MTHATGEEVRKVRQQLGEDQTAFGARFKKTRRTVIRWEKSGTSFTETQRAFYAGAAAMLGLFSSVDDSVDVDAGVEYLNQLTAEVRDFAARLDRGRPCV